MHVISRVVICIAAIASISPVSSTSAVEPIKVGLNDLVVYDPGVHERGLPSPQLITTPTGEIRVEIPPVLHIHRYFYSGDKEFQGPLINGGPTMVVARHPKTGETLYIEVVLPPGAPVIAYNSKSITYVYTDQRIEVTFSHFGFNGDRVTVSQCSGRGFARTTRDAKLHAAEKFHKCLQESQLAQAIAEVGTCGKSATVGAVSTVGCATATTIKAAGSLAKVIPGVVPLQSKYEDRFQRRYETSIEHAQRIAPKSLDVRTNR